MPTYEYECGSCRYRFDLRQGFDDEPEAECPQCNNRARRVFHPAPIIYKGTGFYVTDSRNKNEPLAKKEKPVSGEKPATSDSSGGK
jgi:putative FmdB family regulatory protein